MIIIDDNIGNITYIEENKEGFSNQTVMLNDRGILGKWKYHQTKLLTPGACICLMTDGISEDISPSDRSQIPMIFRNLSNIGQQEAESFLEKELKNWKTPNHTDDKSIAAILKL